MISTSSRIDRPLKDLTSLAGEYAMSACFSEQWQEAARQLYPRASTLGNNYARGRAYNSQIMTFGATALEDIAEEAAQKAIDRFDPAKHKSFETFFSQVFRNLFLDQLRKIKSRIRVFFEK